VLSTMSDKVMVFPPPSVDLAFDESILDCVREMWKRIMSDEVEEAEFLRFGQRGVGEEDEA
jgi:Rab proteins geranylgeranyltransferase component A